MENVEGTEMRRLTGDPPLELFTLQSILFMCGLHKAPTLLTQLLLI